MNKEAILNLLQNIYVNKLVGVAPIDALTFSIEKGFLERTQSGNFILSEKGLNLLNGIIDWSDL